MSVLAAMRPDDWNLPLFAHVLGAMILVGGLFSGAGFLALARGEARSLRLGYGSLLAISLPGWVLMRVGAEWIASKEGWDNLPEGDDGPLWLSLGTTIADAGGLVLLGTLVLGGFGVYRLRAGKGSLVLRTTLALSIVLLAAYVVAAWAMAAKPT